MLSLSLLAERTCQGFPVIVDHAVVNEQQAVQPAGEIGQELEDLVLWIEPRLNDAADHEAHVLDS